MVVVVVVVVDSGGDDDYDHYLLTFKVSETCKSCYANN